MAIMKNISFTNLAFLTILIFVGLQLTSCDNDESRTQRRQRTHRGRHRNNGRTIMQDDAEPVPTADGGMVNGEEHVSNTGDTRISDMLRRRISQGDFSAENPLLLVNASQFLPWEKDLYEYDDTAYGDYDDGDTDRQRSTTPRDIINNDQMDSETIQETATTNAPSITYEQWVIRMRAKHRRMFLIQTKILRGLGMESQPNVTGRQFTNQDINTINRYREKLNETNERNLYDGDNAYAKRFQLVSPSCDIPPRTHRVWRDPEVFRLYFLVESIEENPLVNTRVLTSVLRLYKKASHGKHNEDGDEEDDVEESQPEDSESERHSSRSKRKRSRRKRERNGGNSRKRQNNSKDRTRPSRPTQLPEVETKDKLLIVAYYYRKAVKRNGRVKKDIAGTAVIDKEYTGWVEIDIKSIVHRWMKRPAKNFGLEVYVEDGEQVAHNPFEIFDSSNCTIGLGDEDATVYNITDDRQLSDLLDHASFNRTEPELEISHIDVPKADVQSRTRRSSVPSRCVREKIFVSFADLGFNDWIVAPQGLETGYCLGHCLPVVRQDRYDLGMTLQQDTESHKECCGPTKLKPFRFLHYTQDKKLTVSSLEDFIIVECGCRD